MKITIPRLIFLSAVFIGQIVAFLFFENIANLLSRPVYYIVYSGSIFWRILVFLIISVVVAAFFRLLNKYTLEINNLKDIKVGKTLVLFIGGFVTVFAFPMIIGIPLFTIWGLVAKAITLLPK